MKSRAISISLLLSLLFLPIWATADQPQMPQPDYQKIFDWHNQINNKPASELTSSVEHNYDVKAYYISLNVDLTGHYIDGYCTITMESVVPDLPAIQLDLCDLTVTACDFNGSATTFVQDTGFVTVNLAIPQNPGQDFTVTVYYNGHPASGMYFEDNPVSMCTATEPVDSRYWFPCYDDPSDKANSSDVVITVAGDYVVTSNGLELSRQYTQGKTVSHWHESHAIPTYLIAVAVRDFSIINDQYMGMPLIYFVYPEDVGDAQICYEHMPDMFDFYDSVFGTYPCADEKYAITELPYGGAMEHTTNCFLDAGFVVPNHTSDWVLAHEFSHQWWGDWVTCGTWKDIWLNEGFATYCDALFYQHYYGEDSFQQRMQHNAQSYFNEDADYRFSIYDPVYMWGATVYEKGAWVLHMLRGLFDDDNAFFQMMRDYGNTYANGNAITSQFQDQAQTHYGSNLDWFFTEWVYLAGYPEIEYSWVADGTTVNMHLAQVQEVDDLTPLFSMPVTIRLNTVSGDEDFKIWMSQADEDFQFNASADVTGLQFDPDNWLLCKKKDVTAVNLRYFTATAQNNSITLNWAVDADEPIIGYNILRQLAKNTAQPNLVLPEEKPGSQFKEPWLKLNDQVITGENPYTYVDSQVQSGENYRYKLEVVTAGGTKTLGEASAAMGVEPLVFSLAQNYPNPFADVTNIAFTLPTAGQIDLSLYDIAGRLVKNIASGYYPSGEHKLTLDGKDLTSGIYILRLTAGEQMASCRVVLSK
jgi:hypothetical protein